MSILEVENARASELKDTRKWRFGPRPKKIQCTCVICEHTFYAADKRGKYCSAECHRIATRVANRKRLSAKKEQQKNKVPERTGTTVSIDKMTVWFNLLEKLRAPWVIEWHSTHVEDKNSANPRKVLGWSDLYGSDRRPLAQFRWLYADCVKLVRNAPTLALLLHEILNFCSKPVPQGDEKAAIRHCREWDNLLERAEALLDTVTADLIC